MNTLKTLLILLIGVITSSCITAGLEDLPVYQEAEILDFRLEYRYTKTHDNGVESLAVTTLGGEVDILEESAKITLSPTVPDASSSFPELERQKVSLSNIVAYAKLSPAAEIQPLNGAPELGVPSNFSQERQYKVIAADGKTTKVWTIVIKPLKK